MIKEVKLSEIIEYALKYFPNFKVFENPFEKVYAYFKNGKVIGFVACSIIYERAEIEYFAVDEKYRGKGIAQKLLDYLIFQIYDAFNISLEVRCNNERAINFYLKNGFEKASIRKNYYDKEDAYLMIKKLR